MDLHDGAVWKLARRSDVCDHGGHAGSERLCDDSRGFATRAGSKLNRDRGAPDPGAKSLLSDIASLDHRGSHSELQRKSFEATVLSGFRLGPTIASGRLEPLR